MDEGEKWRKRFNRERLSRLEAEKHLEEKSLVLYETNKLLKELVAKQGSQLEVEGDRFVAVFQASTDGILLMNSRGKVVEANSSICRMLGYTREMMLGMGGPRLVAGKDWRLARSAFRQVRQTGYCRYEAELVRTDGSTVPAEVVGTQVKVGSEKIIQGIIRDISKWRKAEELLRNARDEAERANEAKSLFLATMSHEIRTPLNGVIGFTDLVLNSELSGEQRENLLMVQRSGDILLNIINDILDFSRIESGKLVLESVDFEVAECVEEVLDLHAQSASTKHIDLLYSMDKDLPVTVCGDVTRVRQVLMNLISNALKFTSEGAIRVDVRGDDGMLIFVVTDSGVGFDPAKSKALFEAFTQEDASTTRKYGGTGLGLAICRSLVEKMGGEISASSEPGEGAEFRFTIPLLKGASGPTDVREAIGFFKGKRVLLIDDHEMNLLYLEKRLGMWGFDTVCRTSGSEGLKAMKEGSFDVILVDMIMPEMDGIEFAERASEVKNTPIVLLTSARLSGSLEKALDAGVRKVLFKPVRERELLKILKRSVLGTDEVCRESERVSAVGKGQQERGRLLVAEDNVINAKLAVLLLGRMGFDVAIAPNGAEAIAMLKADHGFDAVLMDMRMPVMDGLEATAKIRSGEVGEAMKGIPILGVTANVLPSDQLACMEAGMNGYLAKPLRPDEVEEAIGSLLG
jgi:two-component system sensor histidine kinase/response regulator